MDSKNKIYDTSAFPAVGIEYETMPISHKDIKDNEVAFNIFLNAVRERDNTYNNAMKTNEDLEQKLDKANKRISYLNAKSVERRDSVIMMTIAEFLLSIGLSGIIDGQHIITNILIISGVLLTVISLYFNFKK